MVCKNCGESLDNKAVVCPSCGRKVKKPIYKKWWFWVIIVIVLISIGASASSGDDENNSDSSSKTTITTSENASNSKKEETITYEKVELSTLVDDLKSNALKAEKTYQNKYVEVSGLIENFDSDGKYISIEQSTNDLSFVSVMCYIKNDAQRDFLMEKSVGDTVTIKGKITSIGEVLGYSINIKEVS